LTTYPLIYSNPGLKVASLRQKASFTENVLSRGFHTILKVLLILLLQTEV